MAQEYLKRGDFVRAAIFGWEACVTHVCEERGLSGGEYSEERESTRKEFECELRAHCHSRERATAYWMLKSIRNSLAHGTPPEREDVRDALADPSALRRELRSALERFFEEPGFY